MDHPPAGVDQEQAGADAVEGIGECGRFGGLEIDQLADQHRAANVRDDQAHAPAHLVVDDAIPLVTEDAEKGDAGG